MTTSPAKKEMDPVTLDEAPSPRTSRGIQLVSLPLAMKIARIFEQTVEAVFELEESD